MDDIIKYKGLKIEDMIYEIRGKQMIIDSQIFVTKRQDYLYYKI